MDLCIQTIFHNFNLPLSFFIFYFPPLHNFVIFPPQFFIPSCTILLFSLLLINFFYSLLHNFVILIPSSFVNSLVLYNSKLFPPPLLLEFLPPQFLLFSLLNLDFPPPPPPPHLFYIFFHPQIRRPHIDPTSTLNSTFFQHSFVNSKTIYNHHRTFLLFSLHPHHHHHHHHHISIVFSPPPHHFYCFHSSFFFSSRQVIWFWLFWPEFGLFGLGLPWLTFYITCLLEK